MVVLSHTYEESRSITRKMLVIAISISIALHLHFETIINVDKLRLLSLCLHFCTENCIVITCLIMLVNSQVNSNLR